MCMEKPDKPIELKLIKYQKNNLSLDKILNIKLNLYNILNKYALKPPKLLNNSKTTLKM